MVQDNSQNWFEIEAALFKVLADFFPDQDEGILKHSALSLYETYSYSVGYENLLQADVPPSAEKDALAKICQRLKMCSRDLGQLGSRGSTSLASVAKKYRPHDFQLDLTQNPANVLASMLRALADEITQASSDLNEDGTSILFTDEVAAELRSKRGPKLQLTKESVAFEIAKIFEDMTGKRAAITTNSYTDGKQRGGLYLKLVEKIFTILNLDGQVDHAARKAILAVRKDN